MNTSTEAIHVTLDLVYMFHMVSTISILQNKLFHTTISHNDHNFEFWVKMVMMLGGGGGGGNLDL